MVVCASGNVPAINTYGVFGCSYATCCINNAWSVLVVYILVFNNIRFCNKYFLGWRLVKVDDLDKMLIVREYNGCTIMIRKPSVWEK